MDESLAAVPADPRIRAIRLSHTGNVATARNAAMNAASGTLIGFLDSDDRWRPEKLTRQIARLSAQPESGWCYGSHSLIDLHGHATPFRSAPPWQPREGSITSALLTSTAGVAMQTVLVRREIATSIGFDERIPFSDDHDFIVRLAFASSACVVDEIVADVREHAGRTTLERYEQTLGIAMAYRGYGRIVTDPALKRVCAQRSRQLILYLPGARTRGRGAASRHHECDPGVVRTSGHTAAVATRGEIALSRPDA